MQHLFPPAPRSESTVVQKRLEAVRNTLLATTSPETTAKRFRIQGLGFRVYGVGFNAWGFGAQGFRALGVHIVLA